MAQQQLREAHKPVLTKEVAGLWSAYFHPERDEKPLHKTGNKYRETFHYPPIRPDLAPESAAREDAEPSPLLYVDATLGEAGHARLLLTQQAEDVPGLKRPLPHLLGIDADLQMLQRAQYFLDAALGPEQRRSRCSFVSQRFSDYFCKLPADSLNADLILFDLGISLFHYSAEAARGFSFCPENPDEVLDMRLDPSRGQSAAELLRSSSEAELADILWRYGELHNSRQLARRIVGQRDTLDLHKAQVLADFLRQIHPTSSAKRSARQKSSSGRGKPRIHPATQVFQALRIAVNDELGQLQRSLPAALQQLRLYGLLAVISFHSLEDLIVKQQLRDWQEQGRVQWVYKKALKAAYDTPLPSERSARLRVVRRMA